VLLVNRLKGKELRMAAHGLAHGPLGEICLQLLSCVNALWGLAQFRGWKGRLPVVLIRSIGNLASVLTLLGAGRNLADGKMCSAGKA
jgi:hypothetical protein